MKMKDTGWLELSIEYKREVVCDRCSIYSNRMWDFITIKPKKTKVHLCYKCWLSIGNWFRKG